MATGAHAIHEQLRKELEKYITAQYFGKTPLLLSAVQDKLDEEGRLYQKPFIESSPAYKTVHDGLYTLQLPDWLREFFVTMAKNNLGVFSSPFVHQLKALETACAGKDLFVATGTGSGKTECFMWPLMAKLVTEARTNPVSWSQRGVRVMIMYPMNALVSDQVSRLRRLIGDNEHRFVSLFRETAGDNARRPQFGMYTGRTPYPGEQPSDSQDKQLAQTLARMLPPKDEKERDFYNDLIRAGKIPAKEDLSAFLERLKAGRHIPDEEDAELITRFEMQQFCPDILITNYSMLEYMLLRPREQKIWDDTRKWLQADPNNKLLFIIDEAHMYRGSAGGEVALLLRRLFHKLGIQRDRVQFILTTASMPDSTEQDRAAVEQFAKSLTCADSYTFCYLTGEREEIQEGKSKDIPFHAFEAFDLRKMDGDEIEQISELNKFWSNGYVPEVPFDSIGEINIWMYAHLVEYTPFQKLFQLCRGTAISLQELAEKIFPDRGRQEALHAVSVLLAIAPLAKSEKGEVLFPARMHMLFRGIQGIFACANENCLHAHSGDGLTLGEVYLSDGDLVCPHCGSVVYELYNDRRCGALFYKGYVLESEIKNPGRTYLWRYPGSFFDSQLKEIHLYIPPKGYTLPKRQSANRPKPCYLDVKSGFIDFKDDSLATKPGIRKLYYCEYSAKGRPQIFTFPTCPHCRLQLASMQLTSFNTRGNQSFFNLIKAQFDSQPAVAGKDKDPIKLPNQGRKVLLFSDSRQRAAKLARDMSDNSDTMAARQLYGLALYDMEKASKNGTELALNRIYDFFALEAALHHVALFHNEDREKFVYNDCEKVLSDFQRSQRRGRQYIPRLTIDNAPEQMKEQFLRFYCGPYNTLTDAALTWIEPMEQELLDAMDTLEENGISVSEEEFLEIFNAWILSICDSAVALGHTISNDIRYKVRQYAAGYGLDLNWSFSNTICECMGWEKNDPKAMVWQNVLKQRFMDQGQGQNDRWFIDLATVRPRFDLKHTWYRCEQCSELTPFVLRGHCPYCGQQKVHAMTQEEMDSISFWRQPVIDALNNGPIRVMDTEEHTAQLSYKDQRDALWSRTEQYELRFQDLVQDNETPVDVLSSTTTMEVGIDIGSLIAVGLRNIPPMRENYQQRAGRAGRRGASLSTIVTFCEGGPHDTLYFNDPVPMFRGDPRRPWIDVSSPKLLQRHLNMIALQEFLEKHQVGLEGISVLSFYEQFADEVVDYLNRYRVSGSDNLLPAGTEEVSANFQQELIDALQQLKAKCEMHPELYEAATGAQGREKSMLDALYEEGIVPTYSFPKNIVSTYILDSAGRLRYQVQRGLDIAIGEYAPGRSIVVDKATYQIGGFYFPGSERRQGKFLSPASAFVEDANYHKRIMACDKCGWFGLETDKVAVCPFCGNHNLTESTPMLRPWGFAPKNAREIPEAQLQEEYSSVQQPLYSTLPESEEMKGLSGYKNMRMASRTNQRIIMMNKGPNQKGFMVCCDCGAAMPGDSDTALEKVERPYRIKYSVQKCKHSRTTHVNLGYDFVTDMLVLEIALDLDKIDINTVENPWLARAAQSLAEALRLKASQELDIEFTELVTGYRVRKNKKGAYVDIYLYDSLSSGAGYAISVADVMDSLLEKVKESLAACDCESACHKCLKHYRNQYIHGMLDRKAALELLAWAKDGITASPLSLEEQKALVVPFQTIFGQMGIHIAAKDNQIQILRGNKKKYLQIYPAMWAKPMATDTIFVHTAFMRYGKPYALKAISDNI